MQTVTDVEARLTALGLSLPDVGAPSHRYVRAKSLGDALYLAGHSPKWQGRYLYLGKVGAEVSLEQAQESARYCVLNALASARQVLGSLNRVQGVVKVVGYIASTPDFIKQPLVMNAASDLLIDIFADRGAHTRTSVGVAVLPEDIPVEIELILHIGDVTDNSSGEA